MVSLIGFDKNRENLEFKGDCKLSINFMSNYLYVEPKNEAYKLISASFEWNFIMKKNLLFVFAEFDFLNFCLAFKNEQMCKKIFDYIASGKTNDAGTNAELSIDTSFIIPIFQAISNNPIINSNLIETMATWHQLLNEDDKGKYTQIAKEYGIYDMIMIAVALSVEPTETITKSDINRKRRLSQIKKVENHHSKTHSKIIPPSLLMFAHFSSYRSVIIFTSDQKECFHEYQNKYKTKSKKFKCISCAQTAIIDTDDNGKVCAKLENKKHRCKPSTTIPVNFQPIQILRKPDYEFFENCVRKNKKLLIIFDSVDRSQCYEYFWHNSESRFCCCGCSNKKVNRAAIPRARLCNEGMENEYVEIIYSNHQCQKRKYQPEKYQPIYDCIFKPDFEIRKFRQGEKESTRLLIFDKNDRSKFYLYFFEKFDKKFYCRSCRVQGKRISAKLCQNQESVEYVLLLKSKHVCQMRSETSKIIYHPPDFEVMEETKNGKPRIFLFLKNDRKMCYVFNGHQGSYYCVGCNSKNMSDSIKLKVKNDIKITGHLIKDDKTGKCSFQMKPNQTHICKPKKYEPEEYAFMPKTYDFFYFRHKNDRNTLNLAIISAQNINLCFKYVYLENYKKFFCVECRKMKKQNTIRIQKDADGKEFFEHNVKKHVCKPVNISTISKSDIVKEHGLTFETKPQKPKKTPKIDESKIVRMPDFELHPNKFGVPERRLILRHPIDKSLCYSYYLSGTIFQCRRCNHKKTHVSAKLHKNEDKNGKSFIVMGEKEHVCEPIKYPAS